MSKIEELIQKLCPNGVEYKKLEDVASFRRGSFPQPYTDERFYGGFEAMPFVQVADLCDNCFSLKEQTKDTISKLAQPKSVFVKEGSVLVSLQGTLGRVAITQYDSYVDRTIAIFSDIKGLNKIFFAYVLKQKFDYEKQFARGSTLKTITKEEFSKFEIPLPPMEIQNEIVRILDNFTELTAELIAELIAELTARKKQYEYYRDFLLALDSEKVEYKALKDIAINIYRGAGITRDQVVENGTSCVRYGEIYTKYGMTFKSCASHVNENNLTSKKYFEYGDVLFAITGESVEEIAKSTVYLGNEKCLAGGDIVVLKHKQNPKYMAYVLSTTMAQKQKSYGKIKSKVVHSSAPSIGQIIIPIPSMEIQSKIADILDKFDVYCNDLTQGLPAEIELRKKQYEYYRDKLLTFKPLEK